MSDFAERFRLRSSWNDIKSDRFGTAIFAEFLGTMLFLLVAMGAIVFQGNTTNTILTSLAVGLTLATCVWVTLDVSGGHLNPAVSFAMLVQRKISLARFVGYVLMQLSGANTGMSILKGLSPTSYSGSFGTTTINKGIGITLAKGFGTELMITFLLVLTAFACHDLIRRDKREAPAMAIGVAVAVGHFFALHSTGASMNPARSLGSSAISGVWTDHWVYWVGPLVGAFLAGLIYDLLFAADACPGKIRAWFADPLYPGKYDRTDNDGLDKAHLDTLDSKM